MHAKLPYSSVLALTSAFRTSNRQLPVPEFLAPLVLCPSRKQWRKSVSSRCSARHYQTAVDGEATSSALLIPTPKHTSRPSQSSLRRQSQDAWVERLDQYLPLELRSKSWLENLAAFEGVRPIYTLPPLLMKARAFFTLGLLSYVGVDQGRWAVLIWLIRELLTCDLLKENSMDNVLMKELPDFGMGSLDDLTSQPLVLKYKIDRPLRHLSVSLDQMTEYHETKGTGIAPNLMRDVVGQIWQSVARITLEATNQDAERYREMMSYAHRIIALMHHHQKIPHSIYTNESGEASPHVRKPPMLEALSSRILTILSDSVWRAQEQEIIAEAASIGAKYVYKGHELPGAEYQPRIPPLGTQIWLELVLWSCVESSMIADAAKVVAEMVKVKGNKKWQVMTWESLQASTPKRGDGIATTTPSLIRWWLNSIAGAAESYNDGSPPLELDEHTVSSEVIAAIADGLVSVIRDTTTRSGLSSSAVRFHINVCRALLERQTDNSRPTFWNSVLFRLIAFDYPSPKALPGVLNRLLDIATIDAQQPHTVRDGDLEDSADHRGASFGLLHQVLDAYVRLGDINGALNAFRRLQNWIDATRVQTVREFWRDFDSMPEKDKANEGRDIAGLEYEIPHVTLASFLDLIRTAKEYDLGRWLLYSNEVDGPVIPVTLYQSPALQSALLRFASASADSDLMKKVTQSMTLAGQVYTTEVLRTILQCQIRSHRWREAHELLSYLTWEKGHPIEAYDIMVLAATILELDSLATSQVGSQTPLNRAQSMLERILSGTYLSKRDFSQQPNYSQERQINQLCRILASVPGILNAPAQRLIRQSGQRHAPVPIDTDAFNVLLDAVVDAFGSHVGKSLYDRWCKIPDEPSGLYESISEGDSQSQNNSISLSDEKVVVPNIQTIQIILRPLLRSQQSDEGVSGISEPEPAKDSQEEYQGAIRSELEGHEHSVHSSNVNPIPIEIRNPQATKILLAWGIATYRQLGLGPYEINIAIPGSFPTRKRVRKAKEAEKVNS